MSAIIKIKRSTTSGQPSTGSLAAGELAYSGLAGTISNGGDRLYIGIGGAIATIGGKYFTELLKHTPGTLTASAALLVDSNKKIDQILVDKLNLSTNVITATDDLVLNASSGKKIQVYSDVQNSWTLPRNRGTDAYVLTVTDATTGATDWQQVPMFLPVNADTNTDVDGIDLRVDTLKFRGHNGVTTDFADNTISVNGVTANNTGTIGVATYNSSMFSFGSGLDTAKVSIKDTWVQDTVGTMVSANNPAVDNITVGYDSGSHKLTFSVTTADAAGTKGVASFDGDFFHFGTGNDIGKVTLNEQVINNVTVGGSALTLTSNTLAVTTSADTGITLSGAGNTLTIAGTLATKTVKGVAKFNQDYFEVTNPGELKIRSATAGTSGTALSGIASFNTNHFSVSSGFVSANSIYIGGQTLTPAALALGNTTTEFTNMTNFEVGNLKISGNTIEGNATDTSILLKPSGVGQVAIDNADSNKKWYLPRDRGDQNGNANEVLTIDKDTGQATWVKPKSDVKIYDATGSHYEELTVGTDSFVIDGADGITTVATTNQAGTQVTLTVKGVVATDSTLGVAQFSNTNFAVDVAGVVTVKTGGIALANLASAIRTIQLGNTAVTLGTTVSALTGMNSIEFDNIKIGYAANGSMKQKTTIAATSQGSDLYLSGGAAGGHVVISEAYSLPNYNGNPGQSLITDGRGHVSWATPTTILKFQGDHATDSLGADTVGSVDLINGTLKIIGGDFGVTTDISDNGDSIIINLNTAGYNSGGVASLGVASFNSATFTVGSGTTKGQVSITPDSIGNSLLTNKKITIGDTDVNLGGSIVALTGITGGITTSNFAIDVTGNSNTIAATNTDGGITLATNGTGSITLYGGTGYQYSLPKSVGTSGQVLVTNSDGTTKWDTPVTVLNITDNQGSPGTGSINLKSQSLTFNGSNGIVAAVTSQTVSISGVYADAAGTVGVSTYNSQYFSVNGSGVVSLSSEGIEDVVGQMLDTQLMTNILVEYNDDSSNNGKLKFTVPKATTAIKGVASFNSADFSVSAGAEVTLAPSIIKSIVVDDGSVVPTASTVTINGDSTSKVKVTHSGTAIKIAVDAATASTLGVAKFSGTYFTVTGGDVAIENATNNSKGIASFASKNFSVSSGAVQTVTQVLGDQQIDLGGTDITEINGLTQTTVGNVLTSGHEIAYHGSSANGDISIKPKGTGVVTVNGSQIHGLPQTPDADDSAVSKAYADSLRSGITVKDPVRVASGYNPLGNAHGIDQWGNVDLSYSTGGTPPQIDGITLVSGDRVLIKNQGATENVANTDDPENGLYTWTVSGATGTWARTTDANQNSELIAGMFTFVQDGDTWIDTGWVLATLGTVTPDVTSQKYVQFSAAGLVKPDPAGGLLKVGQYFKINVGDTNTSGLTISGNVLQLASYAAGAGLGLTSGVLKVNVDNSTIEIVSDSVQIAATYAGQTSITTVGTIGTGTWNGDAIGTAYGGTGLNTVNAGDLLYGAGAGTWGALARGAAGKFLQVNSAGTNVEYGDIDGGEY